MDKRQFFCNLPKPTPNPNKTALSKIWCNLNDIEYQLSKNLSDSTLQNLYLDINNAQNELNSFNQIDFKKTEQKKLCRYLDKSNKLHLKIKNKLDSDTLSNLQKNLISEPNTCTQEVSQPIEPEVTITRDDSMKQNNIQLSENESSALELITNLLGDLVCASDINYTKDSSSLKINYKNDDKWICKLFLNQEPYVIHVFDAEHGFISFDFDSIGDLNDIGHMFVDIVKNYI